MKQRDQVTVRIKGLITPMEWDSQGNVVGISISAFDEQVYPVYPDEKSRSLIPMVRQAVVVHGTILEDEGKRQLKVIDVLPLPFEFQQ